MVTAGLSSYSRRRDSDLARTAARWESVCAAMSEGIEALLEGKNSTTRAGAYAASDRMFQSAQEAIFLVYEIPFEQVNTRMMEGGLGLFPLIHKVLDEVHGRKLDNSNLLSQFIYFKFLSSQLPNLKQIPPYIKSDYEKLKQFYVLITREGEKYDRRAHMNEDDE